MTGKVLLLAIGCGLLYFAALGRVGVIDFDEACYAEVAREMSVRGDLIAPELDGEGYYSKPPLLYWSIMLGYELFGVDAFGARAVNAAAAVALVLLLYAFARRPLGERAAFLAALFCGTSFGFTAHARVAITDLWLVFFFTLALGAVHRALEAEGGRGEGRWLLVASAACGLAMLTKGAIGLLLPGAAVLAFALLRRGAGRLFRPAWIAPLFLVALPVGLSWYVLLGLSHAHGFAFTRELFLEHHVGRFTSTMHGHEGSFLFYVPVLLITGAPWAPFSVAGAVRAPLFRDAAGERGHFTGLFLVFGCVVVVFFSLAATKLPNYVAPTLPCMAVLAAVFCDDVLAKGEVRSRAWTLAAWTGALVLLLVAGVLFALNTLLAHGPELVDADRLHKVPALLHGASLGPWPHVAGGALVAAALALVLGTRRRGLALGVVTAAQCAFLLALFTRVAPRIDEVFRAPLRAMAVRAAEEVAEDRQVALVGIKSVPSVLFYGRRSIRDVSRRHEERFRPLFDGEPQVAIAVEMDLPRIEAEGRVEVLEQRGGYAVIRCSARD